MNDLIKLAKVKSSTCLSKSSIYAGMQKGSFPKCIRIGERGVAWVEAEVKQWIDNKINQSRAS